MTTVSVVECLSPISLRTCGSSVSSLAFNRRKLHGTSSSKRVTAFKVSSPDLKDGFAHSPYPPRDVARDLGLEKALTSSPLQSPIPRATPSTLGCLSRNTIRRSPSVSSLELSDDELNDEIWRPLSPDSPDNLFVVGSKPRLHGMWQVPEIGSVTPSRVQQAVYPTRDDGFDHLYDNERISSVSPDNPPPSPVNFRAGMTGVVVGGQKLSYPERAISTPDNCRDFNPGFVKKPLHHCLKCEGRVKEEELSQVTLHRRLSSILNNHMVQNLRHEEALLKSHSMRDFRRSAESRGSHHTPHVCSESPEVFKGSSDPEHACKIPKEDSYNDIYSKVSFIEMYAFKKREKEEREAEMRDLRERRVKEKRSEEMRRLREKIERKSERSNKVLTQHREKLSRTRLHSRHIKEMMTNVADEEGEANDNRENTDGTHFPPISPDRLPSISPEVSDKELSFDISRETTPTGDNRQHKENLPANDISLDEEEKRVNKMAKYVLKKSWSDVFPCQNTASDHSRNDTNPTEADEESSRKTDLMANAMMIGLPAPTVATWKRYNDSNRDTQTQDSPSISPPIINMHDVRSSEKLEPLTPMPSTSDRHNADTQQEITMSATVIVPQRDTSCSQWITFNGDNEPIINYGPDKEDGCDTFLKRLQKAKLCNQNDPSLPSGQQFCFEAMVDKRYNRWKRRRRKKQSEARRISVVQSSESSDENDERNSAMERIIDKMYEQIHGPVPRTPNGSRETPRVRNRRRRKETNDSSSPMTENTEQEPTLRYYDASSEWTSDGCILSSSSICHASKPEVTSEEGKEGRGLNSSQSDDLCSWPYLEQYKTEIIKRLQNTPPEQFKQFERNDCLPGIGITRNKTEAEIDNSIHDVAETDKYSSVKHVPETVKQNSTYGVPEAESFSRIKDIPETEIRNSTQNIPETEFQSNTQDKPESEVVFSLDANEDTLFGDDILDNDTCTEEFEPYFRIDETPRQSPVSPRKTPLDQASRQSPLSPRKTPLEETSFPDLQYTIDPDNQTYSYQRWSRSQRTTPSKRSSPGVKQRLLSRMSVTTWSDVGSETADCVSVVSVASRQGRTSPLKPVKPQDVAHSIRDERRGSRSKSQKVALPMKKQNVNVNLPSLTKNSRSQTVPYTGGKHSDHRIIKNMKSTQRFQTSTSEDQRRSRNMPIHSNQKGPQGTVKEPQTMPEFKGPQGAKRETQTEPDFLFRDYYLRSLYGNKVRMNSHVDSNHKNTRLRKTITVDNLELKTKKMRKKQADDVKPSNSSFTRAFTYSMFDLPNMYRVHNDNLERQANGETVECYE